MGKQLGAATRQSTVDKGGAVTQMEVLAAPLIVSGGLGDTLTNGDFPYRCKCFSQEGNSYLVFRVFPMPAVSSKLTSLKEVIRPRDIFGEANSALLQA